MDELKSPLIIVAAFEPELRPLAAWLSENPVTGVSLGIVGVGVVEGALRTQAILDQARVSRRVGERELRLLFIGSVGCIDRNVTLLSPVTATASCFVDYPVSVGKAYIPDVVPRIHHADSMLVQSLSSIANFQVLAEPVYTTPSIATTIEVAENYGRVTDARFENLELFGVASACARAGVPWGSFSFVTNYLGPLAHQEWAQNHERSAQLTAAAIGAWLKAR